MSPQALPSLGEHLQQNRSFSQKDFDDFARLSGDNNPIHVDPSFAAKTRFGRTVAHGMLLYSVLCGIWGKRLPGAVQTSQTLIFPNPTFCEEPVTFDLTVISTNLETGKVEFETIVTRPDGQHGCEGHAVVFLPGHAPKSNDALKSVTKTEEAKKMYNLFLGQTVSIVRKFSMDNLNTYAKLTGDNNPAYCDSVSPKIPVGLLGGIFSDLLGTHLPGRGTNWLKQSYYFINPLPIEAPLTASVTVTCLRPDKDLVNLRTLGTNEHGEVICDGEALVLVKDLEVKG